MNETLSQSQVHAVCDSVNTTIMALKNKIEQKNDEFILSLSKTWEDRNAVTYSKNHQRELETIINNLNSNHRTFLDALENIANFYSHAGNMNHISIDRITLTPNIHVSLIKEYFADSTNGDDFGFKDPSHGASKVMDAFETLKNSLKAAARETADKMNATNAFGNTNIKVELSRSASNVVRIVQDQIDALSHYISNYIEQTAKAYMKAGENAVNVASTLQKEDSSSSSTLPSTDSSNQSNAFEESIRNGDFDF